MERLTHDAPLTPEERAEQAHWALTTLRLGQSGNSAALHAELLRQENEALALLDPGTDWRHVN